MGDITHCGGEFPKQLAVCKSAFDSLPWGFGLVNLSELLCRRNRPKTSVTLCRLTPPRHSSYLPTDNVRYLSHLKRPGPPNAFFRIWGDRDKPSTLSCASAFLLISTHSTAPLRVPCTPTCLKKSSLPRSWPVEPGDFTGHLNFRLRAL